MSVFPCLQLIQWIQHPLRGRASFCGGKCENKSSTESPKFGNQLFETWIIPRSDGVSQPTTNENVILLAIKAESGREDDFQKKTSKPYMVKILYCHPLMMQAKCCISRVFVDRFVGRELELGHSAC